MCRVQRDRGRGGALPISSGSAVAGAVHAAAAADRAATAARATTTPGRRTAAGLLA